MFGAANFFLSVGDPPDWPKLLVCVPQNFKDVCWGKKKWIIKPSAD